MIERAIGLWCGKKPSLDNSSLAQMIASGLIDFDNAVPLIEKNRLYESRFREAHRRKSAFDNFIQFNLDIFSNFNFPYLSDNEVKEDLFYGRN